MSTAVTPSALANQLLDLGVEPGGALVVHSSYRAVRPVEGGPQGVIDALREVVGPDGTIVMPSWSGDDDHPFDPEAPSSADLGVIADTFWRHPAIRGNVAAVVDSDCPCRRRSSSGHQGACAA